MTLAQKIIKKYVPTIPKAIASLVAMEKQLDTATTYEQIRRIISEAEAVKLLLPHVAEVKARAEDAVLLGNHRIAEELGKVKKATHRGGPKKAKSRIGEIGKTATGVSKDQRSRLGKLAKLSKIELKATAARLREQGKDATVTAVVREITQGDKKQSRARRERALAAKIKALPNKSYAVIVADPEWRFEPWSRETGMDRAADNHYPTSVTKVIAARPVEKIAANDCVLFLWATVPMLPQALTVMAAWGFNYVSHYAWGKDKIGPGYWNREKHELLLIGTRGKIPCPAPGDQWDSLIMAPRGEHSEKPEIFLQMIEGYFPTLPKIELNCRGAARSGWDAWGAEAEDETAASDAAINGSERAAEQLLI